MLKNDKKKWIIRYIKKNRLDNILSSKYRREKNHPIKKFFSENEKVIQGISALLSAFFIGGASIYLSYLQTKSSIEQTQISNAEQRTAVNVLLEYPVDSSGTAKLIVHNNGAAVLNYKIEIISFFDIRCDENFQGTAYPIRVYLFDAAQNANASEFNYDENELGALYVYTDKTEIIGNIERGLLEISDGKWMALLCTLVRVETENILNQKEYTYFLEEGCLEYELKKVNEDMSFSFDAHLVDRPSVKYIEQEQGDSIYEEYMSFNTYSNGLSVPINPRFSVESLKPETVFRYALQKIRELELYVMDPETGKIRYYENYEPLISMYWMEREDK